MKTQSLLNGIKISVISLLCFFITNGFSYNVVPKTENYNSVTNGTYTVKEYINSKWYLVTYSNDGYIIRIVEDDE